MFSTSTAKRVAREAEKIVSLKEDMDAVSWTRVLEIGISSKRASTRPSASR